MKDLGLDIMTDLHHQEEEEVEEEKERLRNPINVLESSA